MLFPRWLLVLTHFVFESGKAFYSELNDVIFNVNVFYINLSTNVTLRRNLLEVIISHKLHYNVEGF